MDIQIKYFLWNITNISLDLNAEAQLCVSDLSWAFFDRDVEIPFFFLCIPILVPKASAVTEYWSNTSVLYKKMIILCLHACDMIIIMVRPGSGKK